MTLGSTGSTPYDFVCPLAEGGMGRVDLVVRREGTFARVYVQKRMHALFASDPGIRSMFLDEARIAGLIRHANVVGVLDVGDDDEGPFLVMDLIEGVSASALTKEIAQRGERLPLRVCVDIARQTAEGLHAAHELVGSGGQRLDVIHRDITPQNILVGFDGVVRVTDFGIAHALGRATRTSTGVLKGKFGYMSPEQVRFRKLDRRSDLFSLGVVLFEMLAGTRLYRGDREDVFGRIMDEPAPDLASVRVDAPPALAALVAELLAKEPDARPADARAVADRLAEIASDLPANERVDVATFLRTRFGDERARVTAMVTAAIDGRPVGAIGGGPVTKAHTAPTSAPGRRETDPLGTRDLMLGEPGDPTDAYDRGAHGERLPPAERTMPTGIADMSTHLLPAAQPTVLTARRAERTRRLVLGIAAVTAAIAIVVVTLAVRVFLFGDADDDGRDATSTRASDSVENTPTSSATAAVVAPATMATAESTEAMEGDVADTSEAADPTSPSSTMTKTSRSGATMRGSATSAGNSRRSDLWYPDMPELREGQ